MSWTPYAEQQLHVDEDAKKAVADWAVRHLGIRNNFGLFVDAGSQNLEVWRCLRTQFESGGFQQLLVVTNSFLVLRDWVDQLKNPQALNLRVHMVGTKFDGPHLAFYGIGKLESPLDSTWFRPGFVFIGACGVGFDLNDGILLGYIGDDERHDKELLFKCQCQYARVILATPRKIGNPGGEVIDILSIPDCKVRVPIYLISTEPEPGSLEEKTFNEATRRFESDEMKRKIEEYGARVRWFILKGEAPGNVTVSREVGADPNDPPVGVP